MTDEMQNEDMGDDERLEDSGLLGGAEEVVEAKGAAHVQGVVESAGLNMDPDQRANVIQEILDALKARGFDVDALAERVGLSSTDPDEMDSSDLGKVGGFISEHVTDLLPVLAQKIPGLEGLMGSGSEGFLGRIRGLFGKGD